MINRKYGRKLKKKVLMETKKEFKSIVIGGDHYNTYGIVRSLGEQGIKSDVLIFGCKQKSSFVLKSKYVEVGFACQRHEEAIEYLSKHYNDTTVNIVICCSDKAEELIVEYYDKLSDKFILPVCENPQETLRLMNKMVIGNLAESCGIRIPKSWKVVDRIIPNGIEFPCLTKPMESTKGHKSDIVVCHGKEELTAVINDPNRCSDYVVQEYIEYQKEISILGVVLQNGEVVLSGCIDKLRTCMIGTSSFAVMIDNSVLGNNVDKLKDLMKRSGYKGLFSAEFLKKDDQLFFLEVNFRNDGNTYVATASGQNLPYLYVMSCLKKNRLKETFAHYPCYFMLEIEDFMTRRRNGVSFWQWKKDLQKADCCLVYEKNDKAPFRKKIWLTIGSYSQIVFRKVGLLK